MFRQESFTGETARRDFEMGFIVQMQRKMAITVLRSGSRVADCRTSVSREQTKVRASSVPW